LNIEGWKTGDKCLGSEQGRSKFSCITEHSISAYTTYLAAGGKKDKKGGKDVKKADAKQKPGGKEKDRVYG